jgi:hypothetical protein
MATPALLARLLTRPCVLIARAPGAVDSYGDASWVETRTNAYCYAEQIVGTEPGDPNYQADDLRVLLDASAVVDGLDAIEIDGDRYELVGPPWMAKDPRTNADHHLEMRTRWTTP